MGKYTTIIYDIDGTILNTLDMNMYPLIQIIKEELGEVWGFNEVKRFASYPGHKVLEELKIKNIEDVYARWVRYVNEYEGGASI
ncbi:TPA: HAD hydrolase-like protein, partial [Enterococcus faecium]